MGAPRLVGGRWECEKCAKPVSPAESEFYGDGSLFVCCGLPVWKPQWVEEPLAPLGDRSRISPLADARETGDLDVT